MTTEGTNVRPPVADIATRIGGYVTADNQILTPDGHVIYCSPLFGQVRLDRFGLPTVVLGQWHDAAGVVAAYEAAVA